MRRSNLPQPAAVGIAVAGLAAELDRIAQLDANHVRSLWLQTFHRAPQAALTRDMLLRILTYHVQVQQLGGLEPSHCKLLDRLAQGGVEDVRRLKIGTVLVREHGDVLHEVVVVPGGFRWQGMTYANLSIIARAISGTAWNGPRFFGLRGKITVNNNDAGGSASSDKQSPKGRRGAVRARDGGAGDRT